MKINRLFNPVQIAVCLLFLLPGLQVHAEPDLEVMPKVFQFPSVEAGKLIEVKYTLKNIGSSDLIIKRVISGCRCNTTIVKQPKKLEPGKSGQLIMRFDTKTFMGDIKKQIYVISNAKGGRKALTFAGNVKPKPSPDLRFNVDFLDFGDIKKGKTKKKKVTITNPGKRTLIIHEVSHPPQIQISLKKVKLEPGEKSTMTVSLNPYFIERKQFSLKFRINTRYRRYRYLRIKYNAK